MFLQNKLKIFQKNREYPKKSDIPRKKSVTAAAAAMTVTAAAVRICPCIINIHANIAASFFLPASALGRSCSLVSTSAHYDFPFCEIIQLPTLYYAANSVSVTKFG